MTDSAVAKNPIYLALTRGSKEKQSRWIAYVWITVYLALIAAGGLLARATSVDLTIAQLIVPLGGVQTLAVLLSPLIISVSSATVCRRSVEARDLEMVLIATVSRYQIVYGMYHGISARLMPYLRLAWTMTVMLIGGPLVFVTLNRDISLSATLGTLIIGVIPCIWTFALAHSFLSAGVASGVSATLLTRGKPSSSSVLSAAALGFGMVITALIIASAPLLVFAEPIDYANFAGFWRILLILPGFPLVLHLSRGMLLYLTVKRLEESRS